MRRRFPQVPGQTDDRLPPALAALVQVKHPDRGELDQVAERVFDDRGTLRAERVTTRARIGPDMSRGYGTWARGADQDGSEHRAPGRSLVGGGLRLLLAMAAGLWLGVQLIDLVIGR